MKRCASWPSTTALQHGDPDQATHVSVAGRDAGLASLDVSRLKMGKVCHNETPQSVHTPFLAKCDQEKLSCALPEEVIPVSSGWTEPYINWWEEQKLHHPGAAWFAVRLIGDASTPHKFTPMALNNLAFCRLNAATSVLGPLIFCRPLFLYNNGQLSLPTLAVTLQCMGSKQSVDAHTTSAAFSGDAVTHRLRDCATGCGRCVERAHTSVQLKH